MKICYLADGQSIHTRRWCSHFSQLGHEVHLITFREAKVENTTVHFINAGNISSAGGNWRILLKIGEIKKVLQEIQPDILHAQYATSYGIAGARTGFHPYIITTLGSDILVSPQQSFLYKILVRYALKKADWITAMAEHMRQAILDLGIPVEKVSTVIFGIDPGVFNRIMRKVPAGKFVVTSTRNFEPVYNMQLLLNAVKIVKDQIPNLEVNLIGEGSQREILEKMSTDLGLAGTVHFKGRLPQPQIAEKLNSSHLFVTTSLSDGNNVSLNEAMACGTPALATDIPANRQWIRDGINGFLVPVDKPEILADKILYVYRNYKELQTTTQPFNDKLIAERALWSANMGIVEKKYLELFKKNMRNDLVIMGARGNAQAIAEAARDSFNIIGFADDELPVGTEVVKGINVIAKRNEYENLKSSATHCIAAFGTSETRKNVFHSLSSHIKSEAAFGNRSAQPAATHAKPASPLSTAKRPPSLVDHDSTNIHFFIKT